MVDVEDVELAVARLLQRLQRLLGDLVSRFGMDFAGLGIDHLVGDIEAVEIFIAHHEFLEPVLGELAGKPRGDFLARLDHHFLGFRIDEVDGGLQPAIALRVEQRTPAALLGFGVGNAPVVVVQDLPRYRAPRA